MKRDGLTMFGSRLVCAVGVLLWTATSACSQRSSLQNREVRTAEVVEAYPAPIDRCFLKASRYQLFFITEYPAGREGYSMNFGMALPGVLQEPQVAGQGWENHWRTEGMDLLKSGDTIIRVNKCLTRDFIHHFLDEGTKTITPRISEGYITLFDLLLVGPQPQIANTITEVEIIRSGRRMVLHPQK